MGTSHGVAGRGESLASRRPPSAPTVAEAVDPNAVPAQGEDRVALVAALRMIDAEQRRAIVLHHLCDLSVDEVARETDAPTGTVKARLARGREALARALGPDAGVADDETHGKAHHL